MTCRPPANPFYRKTPYRRNTRDDMVDSISGTDVEFETFTGKKVEAECLEWFDSKDPVEPFWHGGELKVDGFKLWMWELADILGMIGREDRSLYLALLEHAEGIAEGRLEVGDEPRM